MGVFDAVISNEKVLPTVPFAVFALVIEGAVGFEEAGVMWNDACSVTP